MAGLSRASSSDPMTALGLDLEAHGMWREAQDCWHAAMLRAHSRFMVSFQTHRRVLSVQRAQEAQLVAGQPAESAVANGFGTPLSSIGKGAKGGKRGGSKKSLAAKRNAAALKKR